MSSPPVSHIDPLSLWEKLLNSLAATIAVLAMGYWLQLVPHVDVRLPLLASMGASAFLLFVLPHSPMAQPGPLLCGQLLSALIGLMMSHLIPNETAAGACGVGAALLAMQLVRCLHPPAAATALATAMSGGQYQEQLWQLLTFAVFGNALLLLLLAYLINNLLLHRRYPLRHSHLPHHAEFQQTHAAAPTRLEEDDIEWALSRMDGIIDASREDLIDIYELAVEHAEKKRAPATAYKEH